MRTLALAEEARARGTTVRYVISSEPPGIALVRKREIDFVVVDEIQDCSWMAAVRLGDAVLFDGYRYSPELLAAATYTGARTATFADFEYGDFPVHLVINPNFCECPAYRVLTDTKLLLGPRYAMVRREFHVPWAPSEESYLLVILGGGQNRLAVDAVTAMLGHARPFDRVRLILGPAAGIVETPSWMTVVRDPKNLPKLFQGASAAISAAGTVTWELLCIGVPTALVQVEDNQQLVARPLARRNVVLFAGDLYRFSSLDHQAVAALSDAGTRARLHDAGRTLVDGNGASRVFRELFNI